MAENERVEFEYRLIDNGQAYSVRRVKDARRDVVVSLTVPSARNGLPVKEIDDYAIAKCRALKTLEIPDSVEKIGKWAISGCEALAKIKLSQNIEELPEYVLWGCKGLSHVELPKKLITIGEGAFAASGICEIEIPYGVQIIKSNAFGKCKNLKRVEIPNSVLQTGTDAFKDCPNLTIVLEKGCRPQSWQINWNSDNCPVNTAVRKKQLADD